MKEAIEYTWLISIRMCDVHAKDPNADQGNPNIVVFYSGKGQKPGNQSNQNQTKPNRDQENSSSYRRKHLVSHYTKAYW